jgi:hypothetical protein
VLTWHCKAFSRVWWRCYDVFMGFCDLSKETYLGVQRLPECTLRSRLGDVSSGLSRPAKRRPSLIADVPWDKALDRPNPSSALPSRSMLLTMLYSDRCRKNQRSVSLIGLIPLITLIFLVFCLVKCFNSESVRTNPHSTCLMNHLPHNSFCVYSMCLQWTFPC